MATKFYSQDEAVKLLKASLIRRFKECMRRQHSEIIMRGGGLTPLELRNAARTFAMGWAEGSSARGDHLGTHLWALALGDITTPDWWPSDEWRFW